MRSGNPSKSRILALLAAGLAVVSFWGLSPVTAQPKASASAAAAAVPGKRMAAADLGHIKSFLNSPAAANLFKSHPGLTALARLEASPASLQALSALAAKLPEGLAATLAAAGPAEADALAKQFLAAYEAAQGQALAELDAETRRVASAVAAGKAEADAFEKSAQERAAYAAYGPAAAAKLRVLSSAARTARAGARAQSVADSLLKSLSDPSAVAAFAEGSAAAVRVDGGQAFRTLDARAAAAFIDRASKSVTVSAAVLNSLSPRVQTALESARARGVTIIAEGGALSTPATAPASAKGASVERKAAASVLSAAPQAKADVSIGTRIRNGLAALGAAAVSMLPASAQAFVVLGEPGSGLSGEAVIGLGYIVIGLGAIVIALIFVVGGIMNAIRSSREAERRDEEARRSGGAGRETGSGASPPKETPAPRPSSRSIGSGDGRAVRPGPAPRPASPPPAAPRSSAPPASRPRSAPEPEIRGVRNLNAEGLAKLALDLDPTKATAAAREIFRRGSNREFDREFSEILTKRRSNITDADLRLRMIESLGQMKPNDSDVKLGQRALLKVVDEGNPAEVTAATKALLNFADKATLSKLAERVEREFVDRYERGNGVRADVARGVVQRMEELRRKGAKPQSASFRRVSEVLERKATHPTAVKAARLSREMYERNPDYRPSGYGRSDADDFWTAYWVSGVLGIPYPSNYGMMFYFMHQMQAAQARAATPPLWEVHRDVYRDYSRDYGSESRASEVAPPRQDELPTAAATTPSSEAIMRDWSEPVQSGNAASELGGSRDADGPADAVRSDSGNASSELPASGSDRVADAEPARDDAPADRGSDRTSPPDRSSAIGAGMGAAIGSSRDSRSEPVDSAQDDTCR